MPTGAITLACVVTLATVQLDEGSHRELFLWDSWCFTGYVTDYNALNKQ